MEGTKYKILIVEDDSAIALMYKIKLEQDGFMVIIAENGVDGMKKAITERPDLIMLDVMLPQLDGFAVLSELRVENTVKDTPIVLLTNLSTEEDRVKGEKLGASDYLIKANLTPMQVSEKIKKYFQENKNQIHE